jgi:riboflavin kinase/FMN adenylyltransferase
MNLHEGIEGLKRLSPGAVMSIGNFDGLHRGHMRILELLVSLRQHSENAGTPRARVAVVTFEPHPLTVLRPQLAPPRISSYPLKRRLLQSAGVDDLVILPPSQEVLNFTAEEFWEILKNDVRPSHLVEGSSFNFGKGRGGTIGKLAGWCKDSEIKLDIVPAEKVALLDFSAVDVSSSLIRWLISYGRVRDAAIALGRPYVLEGSVIRGYGRGRQIGIPTANLDCKEQMIPADGVYAGRCNVNGQTHAAAISIGTMPTFGENDRQIEAHLLGFDGDLYDQIVEIEFIDWVREQLRFPSIDILKQQLAIDLEQVAQKAEIDPTRMVAML